MTAKKPAPAVQQNEQAAQSSPPEPIGIFKNISDGVVSLMTEPRGIRNNNPLNIRWSVANNWDGMTGQDDKGFCIFKSPEYGIRAAAKTLDSYKKRGVVTLGQIIGTWAPEIENNTSAYLNFVSNKTGFSSGDVIVKEYGDYVPLLAAMIQMENGKQPYSAELIKRGIAMA